MLPDRFQGRAGPGAWLTDLAGPLLLSATAGLGRQAALAPDLPPGWKVQRTADLPAPEHLVGGMEG